MRLARLGMIAAAILCAVAAPAQPANREPHIGYLYPAGGRQGTVFTVIAGGQLLRGVAEVYVSGEGVRASVVRYYKPLRNINQEQRQEIVRRMLERRDELLGEADSGLPGFRLFPPADEKRAMSMIMMEPVALPPHPLLDNLDKMSLRELAHARHELLNLKKRQPNAQIAELAMIKITIDPDAAPGDRELRLLTAAGLTNPMGFQVGLLPETCELEPNDPDAEYMLPKEAPLELPVLLNGQVSPGDVDRYPFRARRGQQLVIQAQARRLIPYLADAVPGWFQATLALYGVEGVEVAFADDFRFDPDPVLLYNVPQDGVYEVEIHDAIYRGRDDFVYRISISEHPFITSLFPLGGEAGVATVALVEGRNLPRPQLALDTGPAQQSIRHASLQDDHSLSNPVTYAVDTLPECVEMEPNDNSHDAQRIEASGIVNGRIARPGDTDVFAFEARAGDAIVAEVLARRLYSPLDSLVRLTDAAGEVITWNDDYEDKESGLLTHHADSYVAATLPQDGVYYVLVADSQRHGGSDYAYRLRVSPPRPDFALRMTPSSLNIPAGRAVPITVHALRKDGFDGDIEVALKDAPTGFVLDGGRIAPGQERVRMTISAPRGAPAGPMTLKLEGRARLGGQRVSKDVVPSEDMMQAFLYRHLVPSQELLVAVTGAGRMTPPVQLALESPLRIPEGGTAEVRILTPPSPKLEEVQLELDGAPDGITLHDVMVVPEGLAFSLTVDGTEAHAGHVDNLIVEASTEIVNPRRGDKQRVSLGFLPAIPLEVIER